VACMALAMGRRLSHDIRHLGHRAEASTTATTLTLCRADGRTPVEIAAAGGFVPWTMPAQSTINQLYALYKKPDNEWAAFCEGHVRSNFPMLVSFSTNCADVGVGDKGHVYKIQVQVEDIGTDGDVKGTATTVAGSSITFFRTADQGNGQYEWDSMNYIPLANIVEVKYTKVQNPAFGAIDWTHTDYKEKGKVHPPRNAANDNLAKDEAKNLWLLRKNYKLGGTPCRDHVECQGGVFRCCLFNQVQKTYLPQGRCADLAGTRHDGTACTDYVPKNNGKVYCKEDSHCSSNTNNKKCCMTQSNFALCRKTDANYPCVAPTVEQQGTMTRPSDPVLSQ